MKRAAALVPLSREHHEALVLARRACEPERAEPAALRLLILQRRDAQFEPHFATEEATLLPALAATGCEEVGGLPVDGEAAGGVRPHQYALLPRPELLPQVLLDWLRRLVSA